MKRYLTLAVLVLLAVSCGGRQGQKDAEGDAADSLAAETPEAPKANPKAAKADTASLRISRRQLPQEPVFDIVTSMGTIRVKLYKDTPGHRDNFIRLANSRFYDGVLFHRVIDGFMIQGGDPYTRDTARVAEWGEGGPGYTIDAEIVPEHRHIRGALAAARRGNFANPMKESSGSQFYIVQDSTNCKHLDGEYTVFGETIGGLNVVDRIASVSTDRYDHPLRPVQIIRIRPNDQMNKRALEEERRAEEGLSFDPITSDDKPDEKKEVDEKVKPDQGEGTKLEVQTQIDSSVLRGRKLKKRKN